MLPVRLLPFRLCTQPPGEKCGRGTAASYDMWRRQARHPPYIMPTQLSLQSGIASICAQVEHLATLPTSPAEAIHLTNLKIRNGSTGGVTSSQLPPVLREAVRRALQTAGGAAKLRPGERECVEMALRLINFMWANPNEPVDLEDVHRERVPR